MSALKGSHSSKAHKLLLKLPRCDESMSLGNWFSKGPFVYPPYEWIWSSGGIILTGKNGRTRRKPCPNATLPTKIFTWNCKDRTRFSAVRCRLLTARTTARHVDNLCWVFSAETHDTGRSPSTGPGFLKEGTPAGAFLKPRTFLVTYARYFWHKYKIPLQYQVQVSTNKLFASLFGNIPIRAS